MNSSLKKRIKNRERVFGAWTSLGHPSITEIFCESKFDFIGIDLEHSTISLEQCQTLMACAQGKGTVCYPRTSSHNAEQIKRLMESGADGLIVPMVNSREELNRIVEWCKFPPIGKRSYGVARAHGYGVRFKPYTADWNDHSTLIIQIESIQAVEAIDTLLDCPQVDGVMIGPYDLSGSLGIPGQLDHPKIKEACRKVIEACKTHKVGCGTHIVDPTEQNIAEAFQAGYTFTILGSDVFLLWKWGERIQTLMAAVR